MAEDVADASDRSGRTALPRATKGLPRARAWSGVVLALIVLPVMTAGLAGLRDRLPLESVLLLYLLAVVLVAVVGGIVPAVGSALAAVLLANFFFTTPYNTLHVNQRDSVIALVVFVFVALAVSVSVEVAARNRVAALRSSTEAEMLSRLAAEPVEEVSADAVLRQVADAFGMTSVALLERRDGGERPAAAVGPPLQGRPSVSVTAGQGLRLVAEGPALFAEDRRMLSRLAAAAARAWEGRLLADEAAHARQLAEMDRLRAALLAAVGHDLRTPLAGIKAAVSSLRQRDVTWTPGEQEEYLALIEESADRLGDLVANLLDMSRLQAGALSVHPEPVALDEVVGRAVLGVHTENLTVNLGDDLPLVRADSGLLERVVANLASNAARYSPSGRPATIDAHLHGDTVRLRVVDHGPGVPPADWTGMFTPFQRSGDRPAGAGVGLGLAIARGFTESMGGTLTPSETPGGGLTMTVTLPVAP